MTIFGLSTYQTQFSDNGLCIKWVTLLPSFEVESLSERNGYRFS